MKFNRSTVFAIAALGAAGLGLIGAGAGATFSSSASASNAIQTGTLLTTINGVGGTHTVVTNSNLGSNFTINDKLAVADPGTLNDAATYMSVTDANCVTTPSTPAQYLASELNATLYSNYQGWEAYSGPLCALVIDSANGALPKDAASGQTLNNYAGVTGVGFQLPATLSASLSTMYTLTITTPAPNGLDNNAQGGSSTVGVTATGFDSIGGNPSTTITQAP